MPPAAMPQPAPGAPAPRAPQMPAPAPRAPQAPSAPSGGKWIPDHAPIKRFPRWLNRTHDHVGSGIVDTGKSVHNVMRTITRADVEEDEEASDPGILETPFHLAGNAIDATVLNAAAVVNDVTANVANIGHAGYRTATLPIRHPIETVTDPKTYLANPLRAGIETVDMAENVVNAPTRLLDRIMNRGVRKNLQIVGQKLRWIGGGLLGWAGEKLGNAASWLREKVEKVTGSKYVKQAKEWVEDFQFRNATRQ